MNQLGNSLNTQLPILAGNFRTKEERNESETLKSKKLKLRDLHLLINKLPQKRVRRVLTLELTMMEIQCSVTKKSQLVRELLLEGNQTKLKLRFLPEGLKWYRSQETKYERIQSTNRQYR